MKPYIFTERNGIHIIDLQQTAKALENIFNVVRDVVAEGGIVLFVGTKRQAHETIQEEAERCGSPYVSVRWLGGMMTNWFTMRQRINELDRLERMKERGEFEHLTKKEGLMLQRKIDKLQLRFGGIRGMHRLPDLIFIVDIRREETAVREANALEIPIVALVDTNCDPRQIDYVIPSNDDAIRAIKLMVGTMADAVLEGKAMRKEDEEDVAPVQAQVEDEELTDEELLGDATLAYMEAQAEAEAAAEDEVTEETKEEPEAEKVEEAKEEAKTEEAEEKPKTKAKTKAKAKTKTEAKTKTKTKTKSKTKTKAKAKTKTKKAESKDE